MAKIGRIFYISLMFSFDNKKNKHQKVLFGLYVYECIFSRKILEKKDQGPDVIKS